MMLSNQVVRHKTCGNIVDTQKVLKAGMRSGLEVVISPLKTRRMSGESSTSLYTITVCFFGAKWVTNKS